MPGGEHMYNFSAGGDGNPPNDAWEYLIGAETNDPINHPTNTEAAGSYHPGGAHFLLGDGAVVFLSENIAMPTYQAIATRAAGEVVTLP
jgi:hypothetical protein